MTRPLAFIAALLVTAVAVSSACIANSTSDLRFELKPSARSGQVQLSLWSGSDRHRNMMGNSFQSSNGGLGKLKIYSETSFAGSTVVFAVGMSRRMMGLRGVGPSDVGHAFAGAGRW